MQAESEEQSTRSEAKSLVAEVVEGVPKVAEEPGQQLAATEPEQVAVEALREKAKIARRCFESATKSAVELRERAAEARKKALATWKHDASQTTVTAFFGLARTPAGASPAKSALDEQEKKRQVHRAEAQRLEEAARKEEEMAAAFLKEQVDLEKEAKAVEERQRALDVAGAQGELRLELDKLLQAKQASGREQNKKGRKSGAHWTRKASPDSDKNWRRKDLAARKLTGETNLSCPADRRASIMKGLLGQASKYIPGSAQAIAFWQQHETATGYPVATLQRWHREAQTAAKDADETRVEAWLSSNTHKNQGLRMREGKTWKRFVSTDSGFRTGQDGARKFCKKSVFSQEIEELKAWGQDRVARGQELEPDDLLDEFSVRIADIHWLLQRKQEVEPLSEEEAKKLKDCAGKLEALKKAHNIRQTREYLCVQCDLHGRKPGNVMPLTKQEHELVCELTLQSWDCIVDQLARGDAERLKGVVYDYEKLAAERHKIVTVHSDAVPIYLDPSVGKVLLSYDSLAAEHQRRLQLFSGNTGAPGASGVEFAPTGDAMGSSRRNKNRLTWICRQGLKGVFGHSQHGPQQEISEFAGLQPGELPEGVILDSILLLPGSEHARLEDMSEGLEPAVWTRTHSVQAKGKVIHREEGAKVGKLGGTLRELRRQQPFLFSSGVRVWLQPESTMDSTISCMLSDMIKEDEGFEHCLQQVDMFGGEHTDACLKRNFLNNQAKHTIGPKVTAKMQLTDVRFAKLGKDAAKPEIRRLRAAQRQLARDKGVAAQQVSKARQVLTVLVKMHKACVKDNETSQGVLKAARMCGYLDYLPTSKGLRKAEGDEWKAFPSGSSRLAPGILERRAAALGLSFCLNSINSIN